jgi:FkbM family methyltransferase
MGLLSSTTTKIRKILGLELDYRVELECEKDCLGGKKNWSWCVCPAEITGSSIVYSLGVGKNVAFDIAMIEKYDVQVYAFDPTPSSVEWINSRALPGHFHFFDYGVASFDGTAMLYDDLKHKSHSILRRPEGEEKGTEVRFHTLETIMSKLGHEKIDILKMDIEGAEYSVLDDLLSSDIQVGQLLVEFHHNKFTGIGCDDTRRTIRRLNEKGFRIFYVSQKQREFSFLKVKNRL